MDAIDVEQPSEPWYAGGLRFECTRCGRCCTQVDGHAFVSLAPKDVEAIAAHLGLEQAEFLQRYCDKLAGHFPTLRSNAGDCVFLAADRSCRIHAQRPTPCATFPFWPRHLEQRVWSTELAPRCPGVGQGPLHERQEIERLVRETGAPYGVQD